MKSLIVDDSHLIRQLIMNMLKPYSFTFTEAANGVEAVARFKEAFDRGDPFDLVLMDIAMPEMDGQQALKEIRIIEKRAYKASLSAEKYACIIMVTGLEDPASLMEAFSKGRCNGYLTKPIVLDELLEKLERNHLLAPGTFPVRPG